MKRFFEPLYFSFISFITKDAVAAIRAQLAVIPQPAPAQRRRAVHSNSSVNVPAVNVPVGSAAIAQLRMQAAAATSESSYCFSSYCSIAYAGSSSTC